VEPFPNPAGGLQQVSIGGGMRPAWSRDGRELFFLDGEQRLTAVDVETGGPTFKYGNQKTILNTRYFGGGRLFGRTYDISPDGRRFLMVKELTTTTMKSPADIVVVVNWIQELKQRMNR
jgi:eukaryotic-like serine/threonine-protein kinase